MAAMALVPDIPLVAVVRPNNLQGLTVPPNVAIRTNIPFPDAINILNYSRFTVVPLVGSEVPCGHVTIVVAMQFGVAPIVTRSTGLDDYAIADRTAVTYQAHDAADLARQIRRLWDDRPLARTLGDNGRQFFADHCAEGVARSALADQLTRYGLLKRADRLSCYKASPLGAASLGQLVGQLRPPASGGVSFGRLGVRGGSRLPGSG